MIKTGIDIVEINRIKKNLEKNDGFLTRIFTEKEIEYIRGKNYRAETVAGMFAAKEAYSKFLGTGFSGISLKDIEVYHREKGGPYIVFKGIKINADLSISHSDDNAVAVVCGEDAMISMVSNETLTKMKNLLPRRKSDAHKGDFGRVFILGASKGMTGAVCLSAMGALRCGCGLLNVGVPECVYSVVATKLTEAMTMGYSDYNGKFSLENSQDIIERINFSDVTGFGMGFGQSEDSNKLVYDIIESAEKPLVIDADGINAVSENIDILKKLKVKAVITPHPMEMSRLTGKSISKIQEDRLSTVLCFSKKYNVVTVLKGEHTVVADTDGKYYINETGNPGMATGGSGDVLTGMIASFIGQGLSQYDSAVLSVYLHGRAGDLAAEELGEHSVIASDILDKIPLALKELVY